MMYFIFTEEHGFEREWFPTLEDAQLQVASLKTHVAYQSIKVEVVEVEEGWVNEGGRTC